MMEKIDHKLVVLWLVVLTSLGAAANIKGENEEKHHVRGWRQDAIESQNRTSISTGHGTGRSTGRSTGHGKGNCTDDARQSTGQGKGHSSGHGKRRCKGHITGQTSVQITTTAKVPTTSEYNQSAAGHVSGRVKSARKIEPPTFSAEQFLKDWEKRQIEIEQKTFKIKNATSSDASAQGIDQQKKETSSDASAHGRGQQKKETSSGASAHGRGQQKKETSSGASAHGRDQQRKKTSSDASAQGRDQQKTEVEAVDGSQKTEVEAVEGPLSSKKSNEGSPHLKSGKPTLDHSRPSRARHDADDVAKFFEHRYDQLLTLNN